MPDEPEAERDAHTDAMLDAILADVRLCKKALYGNGGVGLVRQVDRQGTYWRILVGILGALVAIAAAGGTIYAAITK